MSFGGPSFTFSENGGVGTIEVVKTGVSSVPFDVHIIGSKDVDIIHDITRKLTYYCTKLLLGKYCSSGNFRPGNIFGQLRLFKIKTSEKYSMVNNLKNEHLYGRSI